MCDVCRREFTPGPGERRCSDECRAIARRYRDRPAGELYGYWCRAQLGGTCPVSGKDRHRTKADAMRVARLVGRRLYSGTRSWLRAYRCDDCQSWHVTSKPARLPARRRGRR
jgi:hypothetical protein